ncbi:MAG: DUF452 family protein [Bacteroidales bacterium]|nr:DUF452 family protein [Bacteroidales bacterium]
MIIHKLPSPSKTERCILFFNGWGMDCNAVNHLQHSDYDVYMFYDYQNFEEDFKNFSPNFSSYKEISVIAWSLGVWVAQKILAPFRHTFTKTIAINGTPQPIHNEYGIAEAVFANTLAKWNEVSRKKFNARMCGGNSQLTECQQYMSARNCENQLEELHYLYNNITSHPCNSTNFYSVALIGENDLIFTAKNQENYWQNVAKFQTLPLPHFPFAAFNSWNEILDIL